MAFLLERPCLQLEAWLYLAYCCLPAWKSLNLLLLFAKLA
jgi:hypothetical protein